MLKRFRYVLCFRRWRRETEVRIRRGEEVERYAFAVPRAYAVGTSAPYHLKVSRSFLNIFSVAKCIIMFSLVVIVVGRGDSEVRETAASGGSRSPAPQVLVSP